MQTVFLFVTLVMVWVVFFSVRAYKENRMRREEENLAEEAEQIDTVSMSNVGESDDVEALSEDEHRQAYYVSVLQKAMSQEIMTGPVVSEKNTGECPDMYGEQYPYRYDGDEGKMVDYLNRGDFSLLKDVIHDDNGNGLQFLAYVNRECFTESAFVNTLRHSLSADPEKPLMLYRQFIETEKRRYDDWDKQYVYHYKHVVLLPSNRFIYEEAPSEYSQIYSD